MSGQDSLVDSKSRLPVTMPVAVIMECRASDSPWLDESWALSGVTGDTQPGVPASGEPRIINEQEGLQQVLYPGFGITLYVDECESYYHNIKSPEPGCFVIASIDSDDVPVPFMVTLSFDEANAYLEGEDTVFTVAMPPELYRWTEEFVLRNYVPEKRIKRKRKNWKKSDSDQSGQSI